MATAGYATLDSGSGKISPSQNSINSGKGTFTPTVTLIGGAGNTIPVYTTNSGRWTQVDSTVFVDIFLNGDGGDEGAGTGIFNINLPFAASASHQDGMFGAGVLNNGTRRSACYGVIPGGANTVSLRMQADIAGVAQSDIVNVTGADQNNASRSIRLKFFYEV